MMKRDKQSPLRELQAAKRRWGPSIRPASLQLLRTLTSDFGLNVTSGDLLLLDTAWYVTHAGLLRLASRKHCAGIRVEPVVRFCSPTGQKWAFKATVYRSRSCRGFVGYGDADPSNVSPLVHGAEMRVAETRAVNRALRKAYGIGICSVEELGSLAAPRSENTQKLPVRLANGPGNGNGSGNGNGNGQPRLRDQLCLLIRQHHLDPSLVKRYATEFCAVSDLKLASREKVEGLIKHLGELAQKDPAGLAAKLDSYRERQESAGAA